MAESDKMVLRTVFLPPEVDEKLRLAAFRMGETKGELVRRFVTVGLGDLTVSSGAKLAAKRSKDVAAAKAKGKANIAAIVRAKAKTGKTRQKTKVA